MGQTCSDTSAFENQFLQRIFSSESNIDLMKNMVFSIYF